LNLARNAVQAILGSLADEETPGSGRVSLSAKRTENGVLIDLEDNGPGLPETARDHLFKAFAGSVKVGGTGLGLAISHDIAKSHGGDLTLVRSDVTGTLFRLHLPNA